MAVNLGSGCHLFNSTAMKQFYIFNSDIHGVFTGQVKDGQLIEAEYPADALIRHAKHCDDNYAERTIDKPFRATVHLPSGELVGEFRVSASFRYDVHRIEP